MRTWQAVVLLNLALAVGLGAGYGLWGRHLTALDAEIDALAAQVDQLRRERDALAAGAAAGLQQWEGRGIVRGAYPQLVVITHEDIAGALPARTTGFRISRSADRTHAKAGEPVRFWLQGTAGDDAEVVRLEAW
jgi:hypothetical protein